MVVDNLTGGPSDSFSNSFPVSPHRHPHVLTLPFTESSHVLRQIVIVAEDHQAERTTLQQVLQDGILPGLLYLRHIEPDLSIGGDGVGRIERLIILQRKHVFDLAADEQPSRRPHLHHLETVALRQAEDVLFEESHIGVGGLSFGE